MKEVLFYILVVLISKAYVRNGKLSKLVKLFYIHYRPSFRKPMTLVLYHFIPRAPRSLILAKFDF